MKLLPLLPLVLALAGAIRAQEPRRASPRELAGWLPPGTLGTLELQDGPATLAGLQQAIGPLPKEFAGAGGWLALAGDLLLRARLGVGIDELIATLAPRQVLVALLPGMPEPYLVLLSRVDDEQAVRELLRKLGEGVAAEVADGVLVVGPDRPRVQQFLQDRPAAEQSLLAEPEFLEGRPELQPGSGLRLFLDVAALRARGPAKSAWSQLDAGGRFLFGPIARRLDATQAIDAVLRLNPDGIEIEALLAAAPGAGDAAADDRLLVHGAQERSMLVPPPGTLLAVSLDRSLRALYADADAILDEDDAAQAKAALSILDAIFGISFTDELLAGLREPIDLFVLPRAPELELAPGAPQLRLPALGLVAEVTNPKAVRALERGTSLIAAIQTQERRQQGKEPFLLRNESADGQRLHVFEPPEWEGIGSPPAEYGLSPTLLVEDTHAIVATTRDGARALAELAANGATRAIRGDLLALDGVAVADYLRRNLELLVVDRVLNEGETLDAARRFVTNTAIALERMGRAELQWLPGAEQSRLRLTARRER